MKDLEQMKKVDKDISRGIVYSQDGDFIEAIYILEEALNQKFRVYSVSQVKLTLANCYFRLEIYDKCLMYLDEIIEEERNEHAWNLKGFTLKKMEYFKRAEHAYKKAIEINPDHIESHINLGSLNYELCNYEESLVHYHHSIDISKRNPIAYANAALAYSKLGDFASAIGYLEMAENLNYRKTDSIKKTIERDQRKAEKMGAFHKA